MKIYILLLICLIIVSTGCKRTPRHALIKRKTTIKKQITNINKNFYIIKSGDNLWKISKKFGIPVKDLMDYNGITSPKNLKIGQKILFPPKKHNYKTEKITKINPTTKIKKSNNKKHSKNRFIWPAKGKIIHKFGEKIDGVKNNGIDIKLPLLSPFKASSDGEVIYSSPMNSYGNIIIIKHPNNFYTLYYAYTNKKLVKKGDKVSKGQVIGYVGKRKLSHNYGTLHFEIRYRDKAVNPLYYMPKL